jgi:hypothetical protein
MGQRARVHLHTRFGSAGRNLCRGSGLSEYRRGKRMSKAAQTLLSRIILGCSLLLGTSPDFAAPSGPDWKEFVVPGFGTRVEYPAGIFSVSQGKSEVGTGERLSTADKHASLTIYARANEAGETPASYLRKNLRMPNSVIQYRRVTPSFFAISTEREGVIYYSRCNFSALRGATIHCFDLVYPQPEKRAWDAIVTRISLSLRPLHG